MENKTICTILVISIALVIVVSGITVGSSSTIYVPDHYSTIQEAVDDVSAGGTIIVRVKTYTENVYVNKRLTIKSEKGPDNTIVHAFEVTADYVEIIGFTVKGSSGKGIYLMNADHCNISDNVVSGFYDGINLSSSCNNRIVDNTISGNHHGVRLSSSSNNNTLLNNIASNNHNQGITIEFSSENRIIDNNASNNWIGIMLEDSSSNNILINNVWSNAYGIFMRRSNNNRLTNNTVNKSGMDGMYLGYSSSNNITNNICLNNNFKDIRLICSSHNNLTNNRGNIFLRISSHNNLTDNRAGGRDLGIYLGASSNYNTLINNTVSGTINGIYLNASSNYNNLTNNIALNNKYGILLFSSRNNTLTNNTLAENSYGIYLDSSGNNSLTINNVSDNNYGITLLALSNNNTITKNIVNSNKYHGFQLESLSNDVTGNNASNNGWGGIVLSYSSNNSITNNTASNNLRGICISYCANNTVTGNIALDNTDTGIYLESSNNNTIYNNYFNNTNNSYDNGNNTWNISKTRGKNIVDGPYRGGNYWSDYKGTDLDGDRLGDTLLPYNCSGGIENGGDYHPLIEKGVSGHKFNDINGDGVWDPTEPALANWTIKLVGTTQNRSKVSLTTTTDGNGSYKFIDVPKGNYTLSEVLMAGWNQTLPAPPGTYTITITNADVKDKDFGNSKKEKELGDRRFRVSGHKFNDSNGNGVWDSIEWPLANWTIRLVGNAEDGSKLSLTACTDGNGYYKFVDVPKGTYTLSEVLKVGWNQTLPAPPGTYPVTVTNADVKDKDFGNRRPWVTGHKFNDTNGNGVRDPTEPGLAGWTIILTKPGGDQIRVITRADGSYHFDNLKPGIYHVNEEPNPGWVQTAPELKNQSQRGGTPPTKDMRSPDELISLLKNVGYTVYTGGTNPPLGSVNIWDREWTTHGKVSRSPKIHTTMVLSGRQQIEMGHSLAPGSAKQRISSIFDSGKGPTPFIGTYVLNETWSPSTGSSVNEVIIRTDAKSGGWLNLKRKTPTENWQCHGFVANLVYHCVKSRSYRIEVKDSDIAGKDFGNMKHPPIPEDNFLVSGHKFNDSNGNGVWDPTELPLANWTIKLVGNAEDGSKVSLTAYTDGNGFYEFKDVPKGTYTLSEVLRAGWIQTLPTPPGTYTVTITNADVKNKDFGNRRFRVSGHKFNDSNGNGVLDPTEQPLANWTIKLVGNAEDGSKVSLTAYTDGKGFYEFKDVQKGNYTLSEVLKAGWNQTLPAPPGTYTVTITNADVKDKDFGNRRFRVSGHKFNDSNGNGVWDPAELPLANWTIKLEGTAEDGSKVSLTTNTDGAGAYEFVDVPKGNYTLSEVLRAGWNQTLPTPPGTYTVTITNADVKSKNFGNRRFRVSGHKFNDSNGNGVWDPTELPLANWTIKLEGTAEDGSIVSRTTTTDKNGYYKFEDVPKGTYTLSEVLPGGWIQTLPPAPGTYIVTITNADMKDKDFGNCRLIEKRIVSGHKFNDINGDGVWDPAEPPLAKWTIKLEGTAEDRSKVSLRANTDANGYYKFEDVPKGNYILSEILEVGWNQTLPTPPGTYTVTITNADVKDKDFGNRKKEKAFGDLRFGVSGHKFNDINGDGVWDQVTEPGLVNWMITLEGTAEDGSKVSLITFTDKNGYYKFRDVPKGTYNLSEILENGWIQTLPVPPGTYTITITNADVKDKDFGNCRFRVLGHKFNDINGNGIWDPNEPPLANWTIKLEGTTEDGTPVSLTTNTEDDGYYKFEDVSKGTYTLSEVLSGGWNQTLPSAPGTYPVIITNADVKDKDFGNRRFRIQDQVIVGAPNEDIGLNGDQGRVYTFYGLTGELRHTLDTPNPQSDAGFGYSVSSGNVSSDYRDEVIAGAPYVDVGANENQGQVYTFYGATGKPHHTLDSPNPKSWALFGWSVCAGDVNGDGFDEIVVGAPGDGVGDNEIQGRVYIFYGATGKLYHTLDCPNPESNAFFGYSVCTGDVDGDGFDDIIVGAYGEGRVYIFNGLTGELRHTLDCPNPELYVGFGLSVCTGNLVSAYHDEVIVGAPDEDVDFTDNQGHVYTFYGATGKLRHTLDCPNPESDAFFGCSVCSGDVDGDGFDDVIVGAHGKGRVYTFYGLTGELRHTLNNPIPQSDAGFGWSVCTGIVGSDYRDEVIVGAPGIDVGDNEDQGQVHTFYGATGKLHHTLDNPNPQSDASFGWSVCTGATSPP